VGYGDGYRRVAGNEVLIGGKRLPVVGKVCMDQLMVHLGDLPNATIGDEVVLLGTQGEAEINASELAKKWGTINYEMTCALSARVPRFYHG
jgi:alanine racemase